MPAFDASRRHPQKNRKGGRYKTALLPNNKKAASSLEDRGPVTETLCGAYLLVLPARVSPARSPAKEKRYVKAK
jgi:hypothetical protein